jgi:hypothetical protein
MENPVPQQSRPLTPTRRDKPLTLIRPPGYHPKNSLLEAHALQRLAFDAAIAFRLDLNAAKSFKNRAEIVRALKEAVATWDTLRDSIRVLKGRGLPKAIPEKLKQVRRSRIGAGQVLRDEPIEAPRPDLQPDRPESELDSEPQTGPPAEDQTEDPNEPET